MNFAQALQSARLLDPSGAAIVHGRRRVDYLALAMAAQRVATILAHRHRIVAGDRVAVALPDTPEFGFSAYGALWTGGVLCTLDPQTEPNVLADTLNAAGAKLLIGWHALAEEVERVGEWLGIDWLLVEPREFSRLLAVTPPRAPLVDVPGDAPALLMDPEGQLELCHADLDLRARQAAFGLRLEPGAVIPAPPPLSDPLNQIRTLHAAVAAGAGLSLAVTPFLMATPSADRARESAARLSAIEGV